MGCRKKGSTGINMKGILLSIFACFVWIFLTAGCSGGARTVSSTPHLSPSTKTLAIVPSATNLPSPTKTVIPTHEVITQLPTPPPTPTLKMVLGYPPEAKITTKCLDVSPNLLAGMKSAGTIVLRGYHNFPAILLNTDTWKGETISDTMDMVVSPNGKWLAFIDTTGERSDWYVALRSVDGTQVKGALWEDGWFRILQWLDDERLVITRREEPVFLPSC